MSVAIVDIRVHLVFSTRDRQPFLTAHRRQRLFDYMGGISNRLGARLLAAGGTDDHAHLLPSLPASISVARFVGRIKGASSRWMSQTFPELADFAWQAGYAAFSISPGDCDSTVRYIRNQTQHHESLLFADELRRMCRTLGEGVSPDAFRELVGG